MRLLAFIFGLWLWAGSEIAVMAGLPSSAVTSEALTNHLPIITTDEDVIEAIVGHDVTLQCHVVRLGDYEVTWKRDDTILYVLKGRSSNGVPKVKKLMLDPRLERQNTSLVIRDVQLTDEGHYTCQVSSSQNKIRHRLIVNVPPVAMPQGGKQVVWANAGDAEVRLECDVTGKPSPIVTWSKVQGKSRVPLGDGPILLLRDITPSSDGNYTCVAHNGVGQQATATITLIISHAPLITFSSSVVYSGPSYKATLWCVVDAVPPVRVSWFKGETPVNPLRFQKGIHQGNKHSLNLSKVLRKDLGIYTCNASNYWGSGVANIELSGRPLMPTITSDQKGAFAENYTLTWKVKSYSPITNYVVLLRKMGPDEKSSSDDAQWANITVPGIQSSSMYHGQQYYMPNLDPGSSWATKVQARNEFGNSKFTPEFIFYLREIGEALPVLENGAPLEYPVRRTKFSQRDSSPPDESHNESRNDSSLLPDSTGEEGNATAEETFQTTEEGTNSNSTSGAPRQLTRWERRKQLMSMVTAISLSCFFYL